MFFFFFLLQKENNMVTIMSPLNCKVQWGPQKWTQEDVSNLLWKNMLYFLGKKLLVKSWHTTYRLVRLHYLHWRQHTAYYDNFCRIWENKHETVKSFWEHHLIVKILLILVQGVKKKKNDKPRKLMLFKLMLSKTRL